MMTRSATLLLSLLLVGLAVPATAVEPVVVCFGDSITRANYLDAKETYPGVLGTLLPGVLVRNAGVPGNTSEQGLARLDRDVLAHRPVAVVVLFGTNDSVLCEKGKYRVAVDRYRENLKRIIQGCRKKGTRVVLCTLLPINAQPYFTRHPREYYEAEGGLGAIVQRYRKAALAVGKEMKTPVVDLWAAMEKDETLLRPAPDGVHPSEKGCRVIAEQVAKVLLSEPAIVEALSGASAGVAE